MAQAFELIQQRIINFETLLCLHQTPLLQEQIRRAISLHHEALKATDYSPFIEDLDALYSQIGEHWKKINGDMFTAASLRQSIFVLQEFLTFKLLEDYANQPYFLDSEMRAFADSVAEQRHDEKDGTSSQGYHDRFVFPLEEMILNREYVEKKLYAASKRQGSPGSDIDPLVELCDWASLAAALVYDRELANRLFDASALQAEKHRAIIQGVDRVQLGYFVELKSPTTFKTLPRARKLAMRRNSEPRLDSPFKWSWMHMTGLKPKIASDTSPLIRNIETSDAGLKKIE